MEDKLVAEFQKNSLEQIRIMIMEWHGKLRIDIRTWFKREDSDEWGPTKKGISISLDSYSDLQEAFSALEKELKKPNYEKNIG